MSTTSENNQIQETSEQYQLQMFPMQTSSLEDSLVQLLVLLENEQDFLCNEIERLESGRLRTFNLAGPAPTETTASTVVKLKMKLADLDALLARVGELL